MELRRRSLYRMTLMLGLVCLGLAGVGRAQAPEQVEGPLAMKPAQQPAQQPAKSASSTIDNDTLIRMHNAGLGDDLLVQTIQLQPGRYDVSPDALIALKTAGLSDRVISTVQAHGTGLGIRANRSDLRNEPVPEPIKLPPAGVDEIGVYYKNTQGQWTLMDSEPVHLKSSGWVKSAVTRGIVKQDMNGIVNGPEAKLLLPRPVEFLIYAPDGVEPEEYDLLQLRLNGKDRQFRTLTGGVLHSTSGSQRDEMPFTPVKVAPHTWTFVLGKNTPGAEYGILPPGTGNATNSGKIYTFAISE